MSFGAYSHRSITGEEVAFGTHVGSVLLVVNVASKCGLTPHYKGLQALYESHADKGLVVLGFPCNQFGAQEPGTEEEIKAFCETSYNVTFPMFAKLDVNGPNRHPVYEWMTSQDTQPDGAGDIKWNFAKFVIGRDGQVVARFSPRTEPNDPELLAVIEQALSSTS